MSPLLIIAMFVPLIGTTLGSATVLFLKKEISVRGQKVLLGFASGVMIAASIWSLLQPAIEHYPSGDYKSYLIPALGFAVGMGFLLILDMIVPHIHAGKHEEGIKTAKFSRVSKMMMAVTLHNIPEGLAAGVLIASAIAGNISDQAALIFAIGIAIQNFPEGAIISVPLKEEGLSRGKAFLYGFYSGVVEPIFAVLAIVLTLFVMTILPFTLAFAAGCMIYVVVEELIPDANTGKHSNLATIGLTVGFVVMMILDIALG
ncbi:MAG: ZIP family metal transporter [Erysipelotrichia bacterium]|nr:ZIP family metal transporter [Erysipelotrichia bacterium]